MTNSTGMQSFLQRMLKRNDDEFEGETFIMESQQTQAEYSPTRSNKPSNWIKKLGGCSPTKREITSSPPTSIASKSGEHRHGYRRVPTFSRAKPMNGKTCDLETIIQEFETGFLSPTKRQAREPTKSGRFVKKIVAAFEEKYNAYHDSKMIDEQSTSESELSDDSCPDIEQTVAEFIEESTAFLGTTYVIESLESRLSHLLDSFEAQSSFSGSDEFSLRNDVEGFIDLAQSSFAMDEEMRMSTPEREIPVSPRSTPKVEKTNIPTPKPPTVNLVRRDSSIRRERKPKIVGAFLKNPIEVEDTSIDWIPITGNKKLPRKKSFKRLLSILTGKKSWGKASNKLYGSHTNLHEEELTREVLHDSGYDEKSCSSSSLTSLASVNDILASQEKELATSSVDRRIYNMTTFKQSPAPSVCTDNDRSINGDDDLLSMMYDDDDIDTIFSDASSSFNSKKLLLEEVSRDDVRLSLGPAFPSGPRFGTFSSRDRPAPETSKNFSNIYAEIAPPLPKHPFISWAKNDDEETSVSDTTEQNNSFPEFDAVELRRNYQTWTFPTKEITYDVPRWCYLSKSEPGLYTLNKRFDESSSEVVYDVPKSKSSRRPRSSVYDDALSLKRRNANNVHNYYSAPMSNQFYAFPCHQEPHYATIKPRNTRKINPSRDIMRSAGDLRAVDQQCHDYNYDPRRF